MKSRKPIIIALVIVCLILALAIIYLRLVVQPFASGRVAPIDNRSYFAAVDNLIRNANTSVDVILYQPRYYFRFPMSASNRLIADLIEASRRGVRVRAMIEQANWNIENSEKNRDVFHILNSSGVEVYLDSPSVTTHSKLVIIDRRYVVIGSSNWSHYSLERNNEANVVIDSKKLAWLMTDYFENLIERATKTYLTEIKEIDPRSASDIKESYVLIRGVADSCRLVGGEALIYFDDLAVGLDEGAVSEVLSLEPDFFENACGESLRVVARYATKGRTRGLVAIDIESPRTLERMLEKVGSEVSALRQIRPEAIDLDWFESRRMVAAANRNYADNVIRLMDKSKKRIWIAMLDVRYYKEVPGHASRKPNRRSLPSLTNRFLAELESAIRRGVNVRTVCDLGWGDEPQESEMAFLRKLDAAGADVFEDSPDITTHCKLAIFDSSFVVIGSTNWSYFAVEENNETAVVIECPGLNAHYAQYIMALGARKLRFSEDRNPPALP